jgi:hypothetical protein
MLEVISVIRCRVVEYEAFKGIDWKSRQSIRAKANSKVEEFITYILGLSGQGKVIIKDPDISVRDYLEECFKILKTHTGDIATKEFCFVCQRNISQRYKFFGLGHYDIQHAINAKRLSVNELITFDSAFKFLKTIKQFRPMKVTILPRVH